MGMFIELKPGMFRKAEAIIKKTEYYEVFRKKFLKTFKNTPETTITNLYAHVMINKIPAEKFPFFKAD